ncbi:MAG TPA: twin-arginine translocation signal domain-containing protein [Gemmatimonadales bacterium]|nr:twin-arginine translocation signal domain-containing protein [Gemmatimonadales bacterium]
MTSRRDFLVRTGQVGGALAVAPTLRWTLPARHDAAGLAGPVPPEFLSGLKWRMLGPFRGGRTDAVSGVPGRSEEFYSGSVNGGLWKTIDGGRVWQPIFDDQPVASIGAIAVAPSAPDTVYVGSGESTLRDSTGFGNGVYKSIDAGKTWTHLGLDNTQHIGRVAVDPRNADVVFVAAIGHFYADSADRGIYRSTDGGKTWKKVLDKGPSVGGVDVAIDPSNPKVVFACLWNTRRPPWFTYAPTNGPGGGLYKSTDGGDTWKQMTQGLPSEGVGRSGIAIAASHPSRVYAVVDCLTPEPGATVQPPRPGGFGRDTTPRQGGFFRSDDGGETWTRTSADQALWGRGWYFEQVVVDPKDPDAVFVSNVSVSRSLDGGRTWVPVRGSPGGDDYHQPWISPDDSDTLIVASDQGTVISRNAKTADPKQLTWSSWLNQPTAQIYHVSVDPRFPYWVTGAQQDSGSVAVRARGKFAQISMRDWEPIGAGGESGYTAGDPLHPGVIYGGAGSRYDMELNREVSGTTAPKAKEEGVAERHDWTQPLVLSPADPHALYYGTQFLYKSTDTAKSWTEISPDLTRPNPGIPKNLDTTASADQGNNQRGVIYTISPSPVQAPMVWIGTDDGLIQLTTDDGQTWKDVTPKELTPWSRVTMVEGSHSDAKTAYASVDRHQLADFDPYIYRTRDQGKSWQKITTGLPAGVYVHTVKEDLHRPGLLFAGTERGAYVSFDAGDHWQPLQLNLPVTSVRDFQVYGNDLIVATHGRGFWVIDDISLLRQIDDQVLKADAYLFQPADAIEVVPGDDNGTPLQKDEPQAENPPNGAYIDYYLKSAPATPVTLEILDSTGTSLETFTNAPAENAGGGGQGGQPQGIPNTTALWRVPPAPFSAAAGMHRVAWDPNAGRRRRGPRGGANQPPPPKLPGTFTAKLTVNGQTQTKSFMVRPDPRIAAE